MAGGIKYYFQEGGRIVAQPQSNAHEKIDEIIAINELNQLDPSSIEEIARNIRGEWTDLALKGTTRGGDDRYMHMGIPGLFTKERRDISLAAKIREIANNPSFSDTTQGIPGGKTSHELVMEKVKPTPSFFSQLKGLIGF